MKEDTMPKKGKFITLYGINNIGKTTQAKLLVGRIFASRQDTPPPIYVKYARYNIEPSGAIINNYLRPVDGKRNPYKLSPREFQIFQVMNRMQFEPTLLSVLNRGISVVAEDYTGTGIAWGMGAGISKDFLLRINGCLAKENVAILMDGKRFLSSKEADHSHEEDDKLVNRVRRIHVDLAKEFGWRTVNANQSIEHVHEDIWSIVGPLL